LSGMIAFDSGTILVDGQEFEGRVSPKIYHGGMDYITQDPFFIDYLSVKENLTVTGKNEVEILEILEQFGLEGQAELSPGDLSGGERQRLALARAMLTEKKVLFLDEPTASLDVENKNALFSLIRALSETCLVICSSHDLTAKEYANQIIAFQKQTKREKSNVGKVKQSTKQSIKTTHFLLGKEKRKGLVKYLAKWFSSKRRGKKVDLFLLIFFSLAFMLCLLADTPNGKLQSSVEYVYKLNSLTIKTKSTDVNYFTSLEGQYGITDVVLSYKSSVPAEADTLRAIVEVIPFDAESFRLSDRIAVGTYFQDKYDIILSSEMADRLAKGNWESLLGSTLKKEVYGERVEFRVVGVMDYLNDFERQYLSASGINMTAGEHYRAGNYENLYYVSGLITEDLLEDDTFYRVGWRQYQLYFDSYQHMIEFANEYDGTQGDIFVKPLAGGIEDTFTMLSVILIPLAFLMTLLSVLFYANILGTELAYNGRFISAFNYMGYDIHYIIRTFAVLNMFRVLGICAVSMAGTLIITWVINLINEQKVLIGFRIFSHNPFLILGFVATITIGSVIAVNFFLKRARTKSWYENIIETRDLL